MSGQAPKPPGPIISEGDYQDIPDRAISDKTCRHCGYKVLKTKRGLLHITPFPGAEGGIVAQEIRRTWLPKADPGHLAWRGNPSGLGLWGASTCGRLGRTAKCSSP